MERRETHIVVPKFQEVAILKSSQDSKKIIFCFLQLQTGHHLSGINQIPEEKEQVIIKKALSLVDPLFIPADFCT